MHVKRKVKRERVFALALILCLGLAAISCGSEDFNKRIVQFDEGINNTTAVLNSYYLQMNDLHREVYLNDILLNPNKTVDLSINRADGGKADSPLLSTTFSAESIKARTDLIQKIGLYGKRLAALAGSEAPATFDANTTALGKDLAILGDTFIALNAKDKEASKYVSPIKSLGSIVGAIGKAVLEKTRREAFNKALTEASPEIKKMLNFLIEDFQSVVSLNESASVSKLRSNTMTYYNGHKSDLTFEQRLVILNSIKDIQLRMEAIAAADPVSLLTKLASTHDALVTYARSSHKASDLAELDAALNDFTDSAAELAGERAKPLH